MFHSSRCLCHSAVWERHHQDTCFQGGGKPRVQPQSHLLQEIPQHTHLYRGLTYLYILSHTHTAFAHTVNPVLLCAVVEQRVAVGLHAGRGSAPDGRVREKSESCDRSARRPIPVRVQRVRLRRDLLQRLPHRLVTASCVALVTILWHGKCLPLWWKWMDKQKFWWTKVRLC